MFNAEMNLGTLITTNINRISSLKAHEAQTLLKYNKNSSPTKLV